MSELTARRERDGAARLAFDIRTVALNLAVGCRGPHFDASGVDVVACARNFESFLRGDVSIPSTKPADD